MSQGHGYNSDTDSGASVNLCITVKEVSSKLPLEGRKDNHGRLEERVQCLPRQGGQRRVLIDKLKITTNVCIPLIDYMKNDAFLKKTNLFFSLCAGIKLRTLPC